MKLVEEIENFQDCLAEREEYYKKIISCKQDFNSILATYDYFKKF